MKFSTIFQRAANYQNLTPAERAFLKILQSLLITAGCAAGQAVISYLQNNHQIDMQRVLYVAGIGFTFAISHGYLKLLSSRGDPALAAAAVATDQAISTTESDLSRGNSSFVSDLEQVGLNAIPLLNDLSLYQTAQAPVVTPVTTNTPPPVSGDITPLSDTAKIPVVKPTQPPQPPQSV